ncbi:hypothetical protein DEO72_LG5g2199 [Vigna unguiculata]|uniref:Uncharacterized protein n=1 Tax=Vigna unguiculata TaxID=3917 RepID=A0A4D6LZV7_VIGUN|nr:hypothetical protein DEO72_LG5g2199 [Vigna unguiculata]
MSLEPSREKQEKFRSNFQIISSSFASLPFKIPGTTFHRGIKFTLKVIRHMIMSLEPSREKQEKFRSNFQIISSSFASLPFKIPGTTFHRGIKVCDV